LQSSFSLNHKLNHYDRRIWLLLLLAAAAGPWPALRSLLLGGRELLRPVAMGAGKQFNADLADKMRPIHARKPRPSFEAAAREAQERIKISVRGRVLCLKEWSPGEVKQVLRQSIQEWTREQRWNVAWESDHDRMVLRQMRTQRRHPQAMPSKHVKPGSLRSRKEVEQELTLRGIQGWTPGQNVADLRMLLPVGEDGCLEGGRRSAVPTPMCRCGPDQGIHMAPDAEGMCPKCDKQVPVFTCPKCQAGTLRSVTAVPSWSNFPRTFYGCNRFPACRHTENRNYRPSRKQMAEAAAIAAEITAANLDALACTEAGEDLFADTFADDLIGAVVAAEEQAAASVASAAVEVPVARSDVEVIELLGSDSPQRSVEGNGKRKRHENTVSTAGEALEQALKEVEHELAAGQGDPNVGDHVQVQSEPTQSTVIPSASSTQDTEQQRERDCSICCEIFAELAPSTAVIELPKCPHAFCETCIKAWWATANPKTCPDCRRVYSGLRHCRRTTAGALLKQTQALVRSDGEATLDASHQQAPPQGSPSVGDRVLVDFNNGAFEGTVLSLRVNGDKQEFEVLFDEDQEKWWVPIDGLWKSSSTIS
jgi:hypothetical protein